MLWYNPRVRETKMEIPGERELSLDMSRNGLLGLCSTGYRGLFAVLLGFLSSTAARADQVFVANFGGNTIGEYTTSGATVNASLISGLNSPGGIAVSGSDLFVVNASGTTIGEYTTSGATVNASLISGLTCALAIAVSGSDLFVTSSFSNTIGEYTTSGATVNASLI